MIHLGLDPWVLRLSFDPIVFRIGGFLLSTHGVFVLLAVIIAVRYGLGRSRRAGLPSGPVADLVVWALVGGVIGARVFHLFDHGAYYAAHPLEIPAIWQGGIAVYGAFVGGILGGYISARRSGLPVWTLLDAAAPAMLIGQMIGRLGCLSNGDAWGEPTGGSWGIVYTNPSDAIPARLLGVPTHPYPLYEIGAVAVLLGVIWLLRRRWRSPGSLFLFAGIGYAIIRFGLTFFRQEPIMFLDLQAAQVIALCTAAVLVGLVAVRRFGLVPPGQSPATAPHPSGSHSMV